MNEHIHSHGGQIGAFGGIPVVHHTSPFLAHGGAIYAGTDWLNAMYNAFGIEPPETEEQKARQAAEDKFRDLDVRVGDIVQLSRRDGDLSGPGAVLQGTVVEAKRKDGTAEIAIEGFHQTPHGNHLIYFAGRDYDVEVLERTFRWGPDDWIIMAILSMNEDWWKSISEETRASHRRFNVDRVTAIKAAIKAESV